MTQQQQYYQRNSNNNSLLLSIPSILIFIVLGGSLYHSYLLNHNIITTRPASTARYLTPHNNNNLQQQEKLYGVRLSIVGEPLLAVTWNTEHALLSPPCVQLAVQTRTTATIAAADDTEQVGHHHQSVGRRSGLKLHQQQQNTVLGLLHSYTSTAATSTSNTTYNVVSTVCGASRPFSEPALDNRTTAYTHTVVVNTTTALLSDVDVYCVGSADDDTESWSAWFPFPQSSSNSNSTSTNTTKLLLVGDMGLYNAKTFPDLERELQPRRTHSNDDILHIGEQQQSSTKYAALLHIGDLAYDLASDRGHRAILYLRKMQALTAVVPYMVTPGNHEHAYNFTHYRQLYTMPPVVSSSIETLPLSTTTIKTTTPLSKVVFGDASIIIDPKVVEQQQHQLESTVYNTEGLYYSYDIGMVHIISYNTEVFFWPESFDIDHMARMYEWLEADLQAVNKKRDVTPWVVVVGHRPMYCLPFSSTSSGGGDGGSTDGVSGSEERCNYEQEASRRGIPSVCPHNNPRSCRPLTAIPPPPTTTDNSTTTATATTTTQQQLLSFPIEDLFYKYGVDVAIYGHVHAYLRFAPVYNYTVLQGNGSSFNVYKNPRATVHVISGAGGNAEMHPGSLPPPRGRCDTAAVPWCMYQSGFGPRVGIDSYDFSFSKIIAVNDTHLHWIQYSSLLQEVVDEWWIETERHGGFGL